MRNVIVKMYDELNEVEVTRTICATNLHVPNYNAPIGWEGNIMGTEEQQRANLNAWITDRANAQHDTILTLISWELEA